jgi:acyl-CoA synthetase (AMP-forming)/AMP-acid ligase II
VVRAGRQFDALELIGYCRGRLADYKVPKSAEAREELPHSPAGKILKRALRDALWGDAVVKV